MDKFIELHLTSGGMITINANKIEFMIESKSGECIISLSKDHVVKVKESYKAVQELIGGVLKHEQRKINSAKATIIK